MYVQSTPEKYLKFASDIDSLRKLPSFLAIKKFSNPPRLSDLDGFSLEAEDIKDLKNCEPEHCNVQLPAEAMGSFKRSIDWGAPDTANRVNQLTRTMVLDALQKYILGGNVALGTYRDKKHPTVVADTGDSFTSKKSLLLNLLSFMPLPVFTLSAWISMYSSPLRTSVDENFMVAFHFSKVPLMGTDDSTPNLMELSPGVTS